VGDSTLDVFGIEGTSQASVFDVERAVAEGGFGVVYRAHHRHFRAPVAIKCLKVPDALTEANREIFLERFRTEAELLFRLSAAIPEIVRPLQFGVLDTTSFVPFIALEWLEGETLSDRVYERTSSGEAPLGLADALELLTPVARALSRAHQFSDKKGAVTIIHRDMKPENVFLTEVGGELLPRILDFGIARVREEVGVVAGRQTAGDAIAAFSPAYAAPEQWAPAQFGATGPWTDVYGLALTLAEVLIGAPAVQGDLTAMMAQTMNPRARPTPANRGRSVGEQADAAMLRALAVDPRERWQTIEAFWTELELAAGRAPTQLGKRGRQESQISFPTYGHPALTNLPELLGPGTAPAAPISQPASAPAPTQAERPRPPIALDEVESLPFSSSLEVARDPAPRPSQRRRPESVGYVPPAAPGLPLGERMRAPAWLFILAIAIAIVDIVLRQQGTNITLGPVRVTWIAGGVGAVAVLMAFFRAFDD